MSAHASPTLYLRYEERHLPPEWIGEIRALEEVLARYNVRVIRLLDRIKALADPKVDHLGESDAMLAILGKDEPTVLLAAAELIRLNRDEKPYAVIHDASEKAESIGARSLAAAKDSRDLALRMRAFVAETIGADLPGLKEELESAPAPDTEAASARPARRRARSA